MASPGRFLVRFPGPMDTETLTAERAGQAETDGGVPGVARSVGKSWAG